MRFLAALLIVPVIGFTLPSEPAVAQDAAPKQRVAKKRSLAAQCRKPAFAQNNPKSCARFRQGRRARRQQAKQPEQPSRPDFTADDQAAATIPGVPDARFWADSEKDFLAALPATPGPWLGALDRRRRRRIRRGAAQRLVGVGQAPGVLRRHRGQHRLADGAVCLRRLVAGPRAEARLHRIQCRRHFRGREDARKPGRYLAAQAPDRQGSDAGAARARSPRRTRPAAACSWPPPISTRSAASSGTWARSPPRATKPRSSCFATSWPPRPRFRDCFRR